MNRIQTIHTLRQDKIKHSLSNSLFLSINTVKAPESNWKQELVNGTMCLLGCYHASCVTVQTSYRPGVQHIEPGWQKSLLINKAYCTIIKTLCHNEKCLNLVGPKTEG